MSIFKNYLQFLSLGFALWLICALSVVNSQENDKQIFLPLIITSKGSITLISVSSEGTQGNNQSDSATISTEGRFIAFNSFATNLVSADLSTSGYGGGIFVHDRKTNNTKKVSVSSNGTNANKSSQYPVISANGRFIVFSSTATNLVPNDSSDWADIYLHDQQTGQTVLISTSIDGTGGNITSSFSDISSDGRYIVFHSYATNLVPDDFNNQADIFLHDRNTGETKKITTHLLEPFKRYFVTAPSISSDGRYIAYIQENYTLDNDNKVESVFSDIVLYDAVLERSTVVPSLNSAERYYRGLKISGNGQFLIYIGRPDQLSEHSLFLTNLLTNEHVLIAKIDRSSSFSISADGQLVTFSSTSSSPFHSDIINSDDVFIYNNVDKTSKLLPFLSNGTQGNDQSFGPEISANGRYVTFNSSATNLVAGDQNDEVDVFVFDREIE